MYSSCYLLFLSFSGTPIVQISNRSIRKQIGTKTQRMQILFSLLRTTSNIIRIKIQTNCKAGEVCLSSRSYLLLFQTLLEPNEKYLRPKAFNPLEKRLTILPSLSTSLLSFITSKEDKWKFNKLFNQKRTCFCVEFLNQ